MATQQDVIKAFMRSLDNSTLSGADALDEAIRNCSGGKFSSMQNLIDCFIRDVTNYGGSYSYDAKTTNFLKNYCGIVLDNTDTGAISGADAGGSKTKTAESIVPETGTAANVASFPSGGRTTINGLTFIWPNRSSLSNDEQAVADRIYTWWAKGALNLIQDSFGMNFQESGTTVKEITVQFYTDAGTSTLASVEHADSPYTGKASQLTLNVNMYYYNNFNKSDVNGASNNYSAGYLDRTLAHEFVHAVMAANIDYFSNLPLFVKEGLAELVHGIDDERTSDIRILATNNNRSFLEQLFSIRGTYYNCGTQSYAGGYMLFRYLAKQAATTTSSASGSSLPAGVSYNAAKTVVTIIAPFTGTWDAKDYAATVRTVDASKETKALTIKAGSYNSTIRAGKNGSNVYGQGGNDTIYGGAGKDVFWYGSGDGNDTISGFQSGKDVLRFYNKAQFNSVTTSGTNVILRSGSGSVKLLSKANQRVDITDAAGKSAVYYFGRQDKANTFVYGANQRYYGSAKYKDTLQVNTGATVSLGNTTLYRDIDVLDAARSKKAVSLTGGAKNAVLYGSGVNDTLTAGSGGASLYGGKGSDKLYGGKGTDKFYWGSGLGNDVVYNYESNKDVIAFNSGTFKSGRVSGLDVILTANTGNTITLKNGAGKIIVVADAKGKLTKKTYLPAGVAYNANETAVTIKAPYKGTWDAAGYAATVRTIDASKDANPLTIKGGKYNNTIKAGKNGGNIYGQGGNDTVYGGAGKDVFWYGSGDGNDTISGFQSGKDVLRFYNKAQLSSVTTSGTNVVLRSGSGSVKLLSKANQRVDIMDVAGKNAVYYFGRQDKANTFVYGANQRYYGSSKYKDTLQVNTGATVSLGNTTLYRDIDVLDAARSKKAVSLTGGAKNSVLYGSGVNDTLTAGSGGASLYGGKGNDKLYGGKGTDKFYWGSNLGNDTIYNYTSGQDIVAFSAGSLKSGKVSGQDVILTSNTGNTLTIKNAAGKAITIQGTDGKQVKKTYAAPVIASLPSGVTYNSQTMTVKLSNGMVTDFALSGNDVILRSTVGNIRIANAKDKILSVVNGNGIKATYKVAANIPAGSDVAYNSNQIEVITGTQRPSIGAGTLFNGYGDKVRIINATALNVSDYNTREYCLQGSIYDDVIIAGSGDMDLYGDRGNDILYGGNGKNDFLWYGKGDFTSWKAGNDGNDVIYNYTKGQDRIIVSTGRVESYTESGNDVILRSGDATITVKDTKARDITVYNKSLGFYDTYWFDKNLPNGIAYDSNKDAYVLNTSWGDTHYRFELESLPELTANIDASAIQRPYGLAIYGDNRDNIIIASCGGGEIHTGKGRDTVYFGQGEDELWWESAYGGEITVYGYAAGQDRIKIGSTNYLTHYQINGDDLIIWNESSDCSVLTLKNTSVSDVMIFDWWGNEIELSDIMCTSSSSCASQKSSLAYLYDVMDVNAQGQNTNSLMPTTSQNNETSMTVSQQIAAVQEVKKLKV